MNENNKIQQENISRVLLVGVNVDDNPDFETSMEELESLADACEMEVAAKIEQNLYIFLYAQPFHDKFAELFSDFLNFQKSRYNIIFCCQDLNIYKILS